MVEKLSLKTTLRNSKLRLLGLIVSIVVAVAVYFLLARIDLIVHGQLYSFGLIFSTEWADSYWLYLRSIYVCLVTLVVLNGISFLSGLFRKKQKLALKPLGLESPQLFPVKPSRVPIKVENPSGRGQGFSEASLARARSFEDRVEKTYEVEVLSGKDPSAPVRKSEVGVEQGKEPQAAAKSLASEKRVSEKVISCPKCKKTCRRPLVTLDYGGGISRLVDVCPYCNQVLGSHEEEAGVHLDVKVLDERVKVRDA
jgi:hypothetical protein